MAPCIKRQPIPLIFRQRRGRLSKARRLLLRRCGADVSAPLASSYSSTPEPNRLEGTLSRQTRTVPSRVIFVTQIPHTTCWLRRDTYPTRWCRPARSVRRRHFATTDKNRRATAPHPRHACAPQLPGHHVNVCCYRPTALSSSIQFGHRRLRQQTF